MCLKLLLLHLLVAPLTSAALLEDNTGQRFITVYPESIAYYHPTPPETFVYITALYNNTDITFIQYNYSKSTSSMNPAGQSKKFSFDARMELGKTETSKKILEIQSNKDITVQSISLKHNSGQSAVVVPADKLGTKYFIPPVPKIEGTTEPANLVNINVTERSPFRLIIVNDNQPNTVNLEGESRKTFDLEPKQVRQVWLEDKNAWRSVTAEKPVAVIFGHPCALRHNCTCGALYTMLPPAADQELKFFIPAGVAEEGEAFVLLSKDDSTEIKEFKPDSPAMKMTGTAILYSPGLLLTLIPETDFAACYSIARPACPKEPKQPCPIMETYAFIVVHKDFANDVHYEKDPLVNATWEEVKGTDYVSARVDLQDGKNIIWHPYTKMAVYFGGKKDGALFGNPAPVISKSPDFRGCAVVPEVIKIGEAAIGWRESLKYCRDKNLTMVALSDPKLRRQIYQKVAQYPDVKEAWIAMRRSSFSGEWYWVDGQEVNDTDWGDQEPGAMNEGQCASMTKKGDVDFDWKDEQCCKDARPVCYRGPYILPWNQPAGSGQ